MKRVALVVAMAAGAVHGDVIFNNFGPSNGHVGNVGWSVAWGGPFGAHIEEAVSFTPAGDFSFTMAEIAIGHLWGPNVVHVRLHADAGEAPGTVLESVMVVGQLLPFPNEPHINNPPVVAEFSGATVLQDGVKYWLSVSSVTGEDAWLAWNYNSTGDMGQRAFRENGGAWNVFSGLDPRGTFRVHGTAAGACYANCDGSTVAPVLNVADFGCFLQKFAAGDPWANCDHSTGAPVLNVGDFGCFLQKFTWGC